MTDYAIAFQAYRSAASPIGQVINQFGMSLIAVAGFGLASLVSHERSRALGILVILQAVVGVLLFSHVQKLFGVQHFYIAVPALGIGVAGAVGAAWNLAAKPGRIATFAIIGFITLLSSFTALSSTRINAGLLLPTTTYRPLFRNDLPEIDGLLGKLAALKAKKVYVISSSEILNWSTLKMRCRETRPILCEHLAQSADIDTRDGFPAAIADADYVVLATPVQYHVDPRDQKVIGLLARDLVAERGVGRSFEPTPGIFTLDHGVDVQIYRRGSAIRESDLRALADELSRSYPGMEILKYRGTGDGRRTAQSSSSS